MKKTLVFFFMFCNLLSIFARPFYYNKDAKNQIGKSLQKFKDDTFIKNKTINLNNCAFIQGITPVHILAYFNKVDALKKYFNKYGKTYLNKPVSEGDFTPLWFAIFNNNLEMTKFLIGNGAEFKGKSQPEVQIKRLIAYKFDIDDDILKFLIKSGLPLDFYFEEEHEHFIQMLAYAKNFRTLKIFIENGVNLNTETACIVLQEAIISKNQKLTDYLRKKGAKEDIFTLMAYQNNSEKVMQQLKKKICAKDFLQKQNKYDIQNPLFWAMRTNQVEKAKLFLRYFPKYVNKFPIKIGKKFITPLTQSIIEGHLPMVKLLVKHGAIINTTESNYVNPLVIAIYKNNIDVIKLLINNKVNINNIFWGLPPIAWAVKKERLEVIKLLLKHGAKCEFIDPETKKSISIVEWTKKLNAKTPLKNYSKIMKLLK